MSRPRLAIVAASESINASMPETVDAAELQRRNLDGEFPDALIQGPLSFDLAYSRDSGAKKRIDGEVVGLADAMIFPDLLSANLTVKAIMYTADCQFGGVLGGTIAPIAFMSRSDTAATRLNSLALALAILEIEIAPTPPFEVAFGSGRVIPSSSNSPSLPVVLPAGGRGHGRAGDGGRGAAGVDVDPERGGPGLDLGQPAFELGVEPGVAALGGQGLAGEEQALDLGGRLEDVAGGDHQVGPLADVERAELVGDAEDLGRGEGHRPDAAASGRP